MTLRGLLRGGVSSERIIRRGIMRGLNRVLLRVLVVLVLACVCEVLVLYV